jgi:anti-sigma-K factor RskA
MNIQEYIASGVVELYVMGSLSEAEREEFERMLEKYPELKQELNEVENALFQFAKSNSVSPRPALKKQILNAVLPAEQEADPRFALKGASIFSDYRIAASIVFALLSLSSAVYFYSKWSKAERKYAILIAEKEQLATEFNQVKQNYDQFRTDINVLRNPDVRTIALNATDTAKNYFAKVYWNAETHESYIDVQQLPVPDRDKQYQLWALVDGKPIDAGVFSINDLVYIQKVKNIERADAWAVTLEPAGGSPSPHLDQLYLISKS